MDIYWWMMISSNIRVVALELDDSTRAQATPERARRALPTPQRNMQTMKKLLAAVLMTVSATAAFAVPFGSRSVLVVEDDTGKILMEKNADSVVPIASLTKLMTA